MTPQPNAVKYRGIAAALLAPILRGELGPGARLPTRERLIRQHRTTSVTIQKALDLLAASGWVRADGRRGTFVNERPPRAHYALAFPWPRHQDTSQFYRALRQEADQLRTPQRRISCFYEIGGHTDIEDYQRLAGLVESHRLAGVIFVSQPTAMEGLPLLEEPGVPRVVIGAPAGRFPVPCVLLDGAAFYERAFDRIAAAGRRRVAVITLAHEGSARRVWERMHARAAARGLQLERRWVHGAPAMAPEWAQHATEMLFQPRGLSRPDALLIQDDNLVPEATAGLRAAGVRVAAGEGGPSTGLLVIAHTNFPYPTPATVPVTRLGFDISQLLALALDRLDEQRRGETPPAATLLPALWETEHPGRRAPAKPAAARSNALIQGVLA